MRKSPVTRIFVSAAPDGRIKAKIYRGQRQIEPLMFNTVHDLFEWPEITDRTEVEFTAKGIVPNTLVLPCEPIFYFCSPDEVMDFMALTRSGDRLGWMERYTALIKSVHAEQFNLENNQYCAFLGIKKPQLKELRKFMVEADTISFESVAPGTDDLTLGESIPDDFDLEGSVVDTLSEEYAGNLIEEAVSALPDARAGEVIRKCFWENKPLHEVGEQLDISRERVRQIQYKALKRLKIDRRIKEAAEIYGYGSGQAYHWGVGRWKDTGYSSTEFLAIKRIETSDRLKQHLEDTCELNTAIPIIADGVRNRNDGYTPSGIRKLEELNREMDQLIQNRLAERKRIAANG